MSRNGRSCGTCEGYEMTIAAKGGSPEQGLCHFAPPTPILVGMRPVAKSIVQTVGGPQNAEPVMGSAFPPVPTSFWCLCWRPNITPVTDERVEYKA